MTSPFRVMTGSAHPAPVIPDTAKPVQSSAGRCLEQMGISIHLNHHPNNLLFRKVKPLKSPIGCGEPLHFGDLAAHLEESEQGTCELGPSHQGSFIPKKVLTTQKALIREPPALVVSDQVKLRPSGELLTEPFIQTRQKSLEKYLSSVRPKRVLGNLVQKLDQTPLEALAPGRLFKLMAETKLTAAAFQMLFYQTFELSPVLAERIVTLVPQLLQDKFGCHVLRRVSLASDRLMRVICDLTTSDFCAFGKNEHSSRVMQTLAASQPDFAAACLTNISTHWGLMSEEVPIYYLLSICLKHVDSRTEAFQRIGLRLYSHASDLFEFKHLKKILCVYLEYCEPSEISRFYHDLDFESAFKRRHQDKHMANLFKVLVQVRAFPAATGLLKEISSRDDFIPETIDRYFFVRRIVDGIHHLHDMRGECAEANDVGGAALRKQLEVHLLTDQTLAPQHPAELLSPKNLCSQLSHPGDAMFLTGHIYHPSIQVASLNKDNFL